MRRRVAHFLAFLPLVLLVSAAPAHALTIRDIIELTRSGVGEDVLVALVEVDRRVFPVDPATIRKLKEAGVSEKVIVALVRSGRQNTEPEPAPVPADSIVDEPPPPQVVVIDHQAPAPPREVLVPYPIYVPYVAATHHRRFRRSETDTRASTFVPFQSGPPAVRPEDHERPKQPVYWGFGGKLRPDAWKPEAPRKSDRDR